MNFTQEIQDLRAEGKTYQEISIKLNLSIGKIQRILKGISNISIKSDKKIGQDNEIGQGFSLSRLAELEKTLITRPEIETILKEFEENLLEKVENTIKERIQKAINYTNNLFDRVIESKIREFQRGNN